MTVRELLRRLSEMPPDMQVVYDSEYELSSILDVGVKDVWTSPDGTMYDEQQWDKPELTPTRVVVIT